MQRKPWVKLEFDLQKNKQHAGELTESQVKLFDRAYYFAEPLLKLVAWITGVGVGKNRWILVRKIGSATAETTKAKRSQAKA